MNTTFLVLTISMSVDIFVHFSILLHWYTCTISTECTVLSKCMLNVWRLRVFGVPPKGSFMDLLYQSQLSGPWAHSQLALCRLNSSSWPVGTIPANTEQLSQSQPSEGWLQGWCVTLKKWLAGPMGVCYINFPVILGRKGQSRRTGYLMLATFTLATAKHVFLIICTSTTRE